MERADWYAKKSKQTIQNLLTHSPASRALLDRIQLLPQQAEIGQATLIAFICFRYATNGAPPDQIAAHLGRALFQDRNISRSTILQDLVTPICQWFRAGTLLPFDTYWDATAIFFEFQDVYLQRKLDGPSTPEEMMNELATLWLMESEGTIRNVIQDAQKSPTDADLSLVESPPPNALGDLIRHINTSERIQSLIHKELERYHPRLFKRSDLLRLVRYTITLKLARQDEILPSRFQRQIGEALQDVGRAAQGLSAAEMDLMVPVDPDELFIEQCLAQRRGLIELGPSGAYALPDQIAGEIHFPEWLQEYVFSVGGRLYHKTVGAIPYLFAAMDHWSGQPLRRIGLADPALSGSELTLSLVHEDFGQQIVLPFRYGLQYDGSLYDLLLMIALEHVRLDIAHIQPDDSLRMVFSRVVPVPPSICDQLQELVISRLRKRIEATPEVWRERLMNEEFMAEEAEFSFRICENAKSEHLLAELDSLITLEGVTIAPEIRQAYAEARSELLELRQRLVQQRIQALMTGRPPEDIEAPQRLNELEAQLETARQDLRQVAGVSEPERFHSEVTKTALVLGSEARCFLHLTFRGTWELGLVGFWCRLSGEGIETGMLDLADFNARRTYALASHWMGGADAQKREVLPAILEELGAGLADPIAQELAPRGVEHLIVSPGGYLEFLPLHCAPLSSGGPDEQLLDDAFEHLTYAPSLRILRRLSDLGPAPRGSCTAVAYSPPDRPLSGAIREMALVRELQDHVRLLKQREATPERALAAGEKAAIIHLASHALHIYDDVYSSGLRLYGEPPQRGWLSVARILADGDFRSTGLVNLAACETGFSFTAPRTVQSYAGIDGAFLARGARSTISTLWHVYDPVSLLFSAVLYHELAEGASIETAFTQAVGFLRLKRSLPPALEELLDSIFSNWRAYADQYDFSDPFYWGTFKCSGLPWAAFEPGA